MAGKRQAEGFSHVVHPFKFPSATGITPALSRGRKGEQDAVRKFVVPPIHGFENLSSFGGKYGESKVWLTSRYQEVTSRKGKKKGWQTERFGPPSTSRSQSIQGVTWRFLKDVRTTIPLQKREDKTLDERELDGMYDDMDYEKLLMELDAEDLRKQYVKFQQIQRVVT
ncbi:hypothetical protein GUITHDRAFT_109908 [Guillardia theta CCMP2712]|uniref:Uncharacterized protein n=1 Tax=Guillardia theta (strain CCMP2712) TaxID=905079 RepID=L1J7P2_GUITC|nr:hypothetical protein GUITHDRAFT_109908 [Guillardia theta CCMP2712]EKX44124.1 hypothetical protein GUITHDRAFT_109908 [Guillardia theta CCMP2712]|eukprot:XP_005831104.1 hypothetical protein GUITHDRAFT_109908 [Guillardia theta CCMP2712]